MNEWDAYRHSSDEVTEKLDSNVQNGLSSDEATKRLEEYGPNELQEGERTTTLQKFIAQFKDFMIIVLMIAAVVSWLVSGHIEDAVVIMIVVILNAIMGVFQENKARSEEHTSELQSRGHLVCRLLLEKKK